METEIKNFVQQIFGMRFKISDIYTPKKLIGFLLTMSLI